MKLWETRPSTVSKMIEHFTAGEDVQLDARLLYFDLCGTAAHVQGLGRIGVLEEVEVTQVCAALGDLWRQGLQIRPEDEDVHTAVENALSAGLGELGQKVHAGRSRNDQVLVDLRLYAKHQLLDIIQQLLNLTRVLLEFAEQHEFIPMPGVTHTRQAMPSSLGLWAGSFVEGLLEDLLPLETAYQLVDCSPLGAAAGYGVPLPLEREQVAQLMGFSGVQANTLNVMSGRGKIDYAVLSALSTVMLELSRLSADLIWYSSETLPFFRLPEAFCTGSSIMPNKRNPDVLELVRAKTARVQAATAQVFMIGQGKISGYHRDHQELKPFLIDGLETTSACLAVLVPLIEGLKTNEALLNRAMVAELFAVDHMIERVKKGTPLRQAYREVKGQLDRVEVPNLETALKARTHLGGTGNLMLKATLTQVEQHTRDWRVKARRFDETLEKLISRT